MSIAPVRFIIMYRYHTINAHRVVGLLLGYIELRERHLCHLKQ